MQNRKNLNLSYSFYLTKSQENIPKALDYKKSNKENKNIVCSYKNFQSIFWSSMLYVFLICICVVF